MKYLGLTLLAGIVGAIGIVVLGSFYTPPIDRSASNLNAAKVALSWCTHRVGAGSPVFNDCLAATSNKYLAGIDEGHW